MYDNFEYLECFSLIKGLVEISEKCDTAVFISPQLPLVTLCHKIPKHPTPFALRNKCMADKNILLEYLLSMFLMQKMIPPCK